MKQDRQLWVGGIPGDLGRDRAVGGRGLLSGKKSAEYDAVGSTLQSDLFLQVN